jgi:hypothetical protein
MRALALGAAVAGIAWGQAQLPPDHPPVRTPDRRQAASRLTDQVAGRAGAPAPVRRNNFIDDHIFGKMERDRIPHAPLASDGEFVRRVHLDLTGRLPDPEAVRNFIASADPAKRDKLIDQLIASPAFLAKWTYWWGDLAMTNSNRLGTDGRNLFYSYIYDSLHFNRPYNELVEDLLTTSALSNWYVGPASYLVRWVVIGDNCADTVHEDTSDEIAVQAFRHFLGINLQCVSCHDGRGHLEKINLWLTARKRPELWQQAAFFGRTRILRRVEISTDRDEYRIDDQGPGYDAGARSVVRIPRGGKGMVEPAFLLTGEKPDPTRPLRPQFARMITSHPQFARATVNLFWAQLMGVGIVDPPFEFDLLRQDPQNPPPAPWTLQPTHPELLEALARDFREHNYDWKRLMKLIAASSAYQLSSRFPGEWKDAYAPYFARKFVRRLTAEEVYDAIVKSTDLYTDLPVRRTDLKVRFATEMRSPEDFRPFSDINFFMEVFGQTNRDYSERSNDGAITQAILLMNGPFVREKIKAAPGSFLRRLLEGNRPDEEIIRELYWKFLSRPPEDREIAMARDLLRADRRRGYEDLQWVLVNKVEFLFNY